MDRRRARFEVFHRCRTASRCSTVRSGNGVACPVKSRVPARVERRDSVKKILSRFSFETDALSWFTRVSIDPGKSLNLVRATAWTVCGG